MTVKLENQILIPCTDSRPAQTQMVRPANKMTKITTEITCISLITVQKSCCEIHELGHRMYSAKSKIYFLSFPTTGIGCFSPKQSSTFHVRIRELPCPCIFWEFDWIVIFQNIDKKQNWAYHRLGYLPKQICVFLIKSSHGLPSLRTM